MFAYTDIAARITGYITIVSAALALLYIVITARIKSVMERRIRRYKCKMSDEIEAFKRQMNWKRLQLDEIDELERRFIKLKADMYHFDETNKERIP